MGKKKSAILRPINLAQYRREVVPTYADYVMEREGKEPLRVALRSNMTFREINEIPRGTEATYEQAFPIIAKHVTAWNVRAENLVTNEVEDVPPPAEAGPDAFLLLEPVEATWLIMRLRSAHLGGDEQKKDVSSPANTDEPSPDTALDET